METVNAVLGAYREADGVSSATSFGSGPMAASQVTPVAGSSSAASGGAGAGTHSRGRSSGSWGLDEDGLEMPGSAAAAAAGGAGSSQAAGPRRSSALAEAAYRGMTRRTEGGMPLQPDAGTFAALLRAAVDREPIDRKGALTGVLRRMRVRKVAPLEGMYAALLGNSGQAGAGGEGGSSGSSGGSAGGTGAGADGGASRGRGRGGGQAVVPDVADALAELVERDALGVWRRTRVAESLCGAFVSAGRLADAEAVMGSLAEEADAGWARWAEGAGRAAREAMAAGDGVGGELDGAGGDEGGSA